MKKKLAYLLACTDNIAFAAGNVAISLNKYMPNKEFDIVIYNNGFQEKNKIALSKIPKVILRDFNLDPEFVSFMLSEHQLKQEEDGRTKVNCLPLCILKYLTFLMSMKQ